MLRVTTLTAVLALAACANTGDEGMIVLNNTAVGGSCTLSGATTQPFTAHGQIFARSPTGYILTPLIQSRVNSASSVDDTQRTIFLSGANVSLEVKAVSIERADGTFVNGPAITPAPAQFSTLFSASLPPAGTVNVAFEVVPPQTLRQILAASGAGATDSMRAEVLATVNILGTLGGDDIESAPFSFPVTVCNDCVVNVLGTCPLPMGTEVRGGNACNPFQDGVVDCCLNGDSAVCPATVATSLQ